MKLFWILAAGITAQEGSGEDTPADMLNTPGLGGFGPLPEIDEFDISDMGRSTAGGAFDFASMAAGGRALPPGVSMIDFVDASGNFNSDAFREALMAAYAAEQEPATPAPTQPPARPARPGAEEANKYFFATTQAPPPPTTTAPPTPPPANWCWKCDAMDYTTCATYGKWQYCELGDKDCCFVEVRQSHRKLQQLCTGCKAKRACEDNKKQNFKFPMQDYPSPMWDQCRPDYRLQYNRRFRQQSVCRQCFKTCDKDLFDGKYCFGGGMIEDGDWEGERRPNTQGGTMFTIPYGDAMWTPYYPGAILHKKMEDVSAYGIPTFLRLNGKDNVTPGLDSEVQTVIEDWPNHEQDQEYISNMYWGNICVNGVCTGNHGKVHPLTNLNTGTRTLDDMTYWGLEGASRYWWMSDLKYYQDSYVFETFKGCDQVNGGETLTNCATPITMNTLIDIYNNRPKYPVWGK